MVTQQLIDYVKQQIQQGVPANNIKNALRAKGWEDVDIDQVFNGLAKPLSEASSAMINKAARPKGVKVISILYFLSSLLFLTFGSLAFLGANFLAQSLKNGLFDKFFVIGGIIFIILGILEIAVGIGLWKYKNWARLTAIILSLIGIVFYMISMLKGNIAGNIFNITVISITGGYLFFNPKVKAAFEPEKIFTPINKKLLWSSVVLLFLAVGLIIIFRTQIASKIKTTQPSSITDSVAVVPTPVPATNKKTNQILSPKKSYLKMKAESDNVKNYADLEAFILKYGSKNKIAELKANREKVNALPPDFKDQIVALAKGPLSNEITTIQENVNNDTAILNVQTNKPGLTGVITLVLENNQWKLEFESWEQ